MILGEISRSASADAATTLDDILHLNARRHPDAIALIDPPNREGFTGGKARRLTYAQADRIVSAIAMRLHDIGLSADSVVATQFANTSESILTLLGIMRAGMIAAPMPLLWRRAECVAALSRIGTKALLTCTRVGDTDHASLAMNVAAEIFTIRCVCGFGGPLPEGFISFDDLFDAAESDVSALAPERRENPALHVAAVTFDMTPDGIVPIPRSHAELLAGGLSVLAESRVTTDAHILSSLPASSFAGIALTLAPWLLSGGTLSLHQPFDESVLTSQLHDEACDVVVLPGPLVARLAEAKLFASPRTPKCILAFWRAPERLTFSPSMLSLESDLIDVPVFGEVGLCALRRSDGRLAHIPAGKIRAPHGVPGAVVVAYIARTPAGTLGFGGPMAPHYPFPAQNGASATYFRAADDGTLDTGFTCRADKETGSLVVTGSPAGLFSIGGYRFAMRDVQQVVAQADKEANVAALPDTFAGHRLAGHSRDQAAVRHTLDAVGLNPLIVRAFRDRGGTSSAA
jgi:AMP-binding enzyme